MADILIRGMKKMPGNCRECMFAGFGGMRNELNVCMFSGESQSLISHERMSKCPIVPLPEGHGRLIDADAVVKTICNSCDGACDVVQCDCLNCKADCRCDIMKEISDAHTIVPAEGGTDDGN